MRIGARLVALAAVPALVIGFASAAEAKCTRLAFSVNDYGKDGPTKDAKELLDKYVAKWTAERGIKNYTIGKKDVSCELFLNLIVVDEHTCKASATVCWPGEGPKYEVDASAAPAAPAAPAAKAPGAAKAAAVKAPAAAKAAPIATGTVPAAAPAVPAVAKPAPAIAPAAPAVVAPAAAPAAPAAPAAAPATEAPKQQ